MVPETTPTTIDKNKPNWVWDLMHKRESAMLGVLIVLFLIMSVAKTDTFFTSENLFNITKQISIITIVAVGQSFILMTGGIDLSVGYSLSLAGIVMAKFFTLPIPPAAAIFLGALTSLALGAINGLLITFLKLPPFIITLGTANIARGLTYIITRGFPIEIKNQFVLDVGNGYLGPIPIMTIVMLVIIFVATYILRKTSFGMRVLSIGGNETATLLSGINVRKYKVIVYSACGLLCGIAGIIMAGRLNAGNPNAGQSTDMDTIAASIVGGTSLSGGDGTIVGTLFGSLLLGVIKNAMVLLNINMYWQTVVVGVVIISVCAFDQLAQSNRAK